MQLHDLKPNHPLKAKKPRVGRGGKRGTMSGKGQKGQKSRAGHRIRPAERDFIQRLHKLRGIKNKPHEEGAAVLNVGVLAKMAKDGVISEKVLGKKVKILGEGEIKVALTIMGLEISKSAQAKIEKAGGKVVVGVRIVQPAKGMGKTRLPGRRIKVAEKTK
ncbi:MAG: uL15 family ribosomal protein [bacterium]|nr:uL15 family ribosomal protein [bacterium]